MSTEFTQGAWGIFATSKERGTQVRASMGDGNFTTICYALNGDADARLIAAAPELYEALENDVLFFDSIANHEHWEATGIGNLCRGYASRRRDLLAKARGEQ